MEDMSEEAQLQAALRLSRSDAGVVHGGRFSRRMKVLGADNLGAASFDGNQIRLPATVMSLLFEASPVGEHVYRVRTIRESILFVGVKDYSAPSGDSCVLPRRLMGLLKLVDGNQVELTLVNATASVPTPLQPLPVATQLTLRWENSDQYNFAWGLPDASAMQMQGALESTLDGDYPVLMLNNSVCFKHGDHEFELVVIGLLARLSDASGAMGEDCAEDLDVRRAIAASLGEAAIPKVQDSEAVKEGDVVRVRVPPWEAFDRKLIIEPPLNWIPPKPFPDAVWDADRRMYYPEGWVWEEAEQTYIPPLKPVLEAAEACVSESPEAQKQPEPDMGVGYTLGGSGEEEVPRPLTQAELREKRIKAMEERMARRATEQMES